MGMIFLFIDGFGIGEADPEKNPLYAGNMPNFKYVFGHFPVMPTEVSLGVPGLPQSATGQTAIFTGVNAPAVLGRHMSGQPTVTLKKILVQNNLFKELLKRGFTVTNANAYRDEYLQKMLDPAERRYRPSVTSVMTLSAGLRFRSTEDYARGEGIYHDLVGQVLVENGYDVPVISTAEAAGRLYRISRHYDLTLFEHFMTDLIGHKADMAASIRELELLDEFLGELLKRLDPDRDMLLITSDHGNIEDVTVKTHTRNAVPTIWIGKVPELAEVHVENLLDIFPAVISLMEARRKIG